MSIQSTAALRPSDPLQPAATRPSGTPPTLDSPAPAGPTDGTGLSSEAQVSQSPAPGSGQLTQGLVDNFAHLAADPEPYQPFTPPGAPRDHAINALGGAGDGIQAAAANRPPATVPAPAPAAAATPPAPVPAPVPPAAAATPPAPGPAPVPSAAPEPAPDRPTPRSEDMRRVVAAQQAADAADGPGPRPAAPSPAPPQPTSTPQRREAPPSNNGGRWASVGRWVSRAGIGLSVATGAAEVHQHATDPSLSANERRHRISGAVANTTVGTAAAAVAGGLAAGAVAATAPAWVPIAVGGAAAVGAGYAAGEIARWGADRISRWWSSS